MEVLNIRFAKKCVQASYEYNEDIRTYQFHEDIMLGGWTISKSILHGGPKVSRYKYDYKNYLEFIITDNTGEERIKQFYYNNDNNNGDEEVSTHYTYPDDIPHSGIQYFLEGFSAFRCTNWEDYDAAVQVNRIREIVNDEDMDNRRKIEEIQSILENLV